MRNLKRSYPVQIWGYSFVSSSSGCCQAQQLGRSVQSRCGAGCASGKLWIGSAWARCLHFFGTQRTDCNTARCWYMGISSQSFLIGTILLQSLISIANRPLCINSPRPWTAGAWVCRGRSPGANHSVYFLPYSAVDLIRASASSGSIQSLFRTIYDRKGSTRQD